MTFSLKQFSLLAYVWLALPVLLFLLNWCRPLVAIPLSIAVLASIFFAMRATGERTLTVDKKKLLAIGAILFFWVLLSGVGGLAWQNRWDHAFRNALFTDLVNHSWPVQSADATDATGTAAVRSLVYYFGFWLPPALLAKVTGSLSLGFVAQFAWAFTGVATAFGLLFFLVGRATLRAVFIFILFDGWDVFIYAILKFLDFAIVSEILPPAMVLEKSLQVFENLSNTSSLFYIYNQVVPFWVAFALLLNQRAKTALFFICALLLMFAPFPAIGMLPAAFYLALRGKTTGAASQTIPSRILANVSIPNITACGVAAVLGLFYLSNNTAAGRSILPLTGENFLKFALFVVFEFLVYLVLCKQAVKGENQGKMLAVLALPCAVLLFIQIGPLYDFAWRVVLPLAFFVMLLVIRTANELDAASIRRPRGALLVLVLCVGAVAPLLEMATSLRKTRASYFVRHGEPLRAGGIGSCFGDNPSCAYYVSQGTGGNLFDTYLRRQ
ncbi:MAG: hypothetical protein LBR07_07440 [Puniceicoccales bacterium]|jgi:hypothetical protein|nr:hypothetical protein [Puniceicoccales bacterium]